LLNTNKEINTTAIVKDSDRGGVFIYDGAQSGVNNGGTIFNGWVRQYDGAVNVKWFGAKFDGVTDDTVAIQAANDAAGFNAIEYPYAVAIVTDTIYIKKSIIGNNCLFKFNDLTLQKATLNISSVTGLSFSDFQIDGQCTVVSGAANQDPTNWSTQYDSFLGGGGIFCNQISNCVFENMFIKNTSSGALKLTKSNNCTVNNLRTQRTRSQFGDGMYVGYNSLNITVMNSRAYDFTRMGFITGSSKNISFVNCRASYGHNQGKDYGGTEYNAGFWGEPVSEFTVEGCVAENTNRGFIHVSENVTAYDFQSDYHRGIFNSCISLENNIGFELNSWTGSLNCTVSDCKSISSVDDAIAYSAICQSGGNSTVFTFENCYGYIDDVSGSDRMSVFNIENEDSGASTACQVNITNCIGKIGNAAPCNYTGYNNGDITFLEKTAGTYGKLDLVVDNYVGLHGAAYIKNKYSTNTDVRIEVNNTKNIITTAPYPTASLFVDEIEFNNCTFIESTEISAGAKVTLNKCSIVDGGTFTTRAIELIGDLNIFGGRLSHYPTSSDTKKPIFRMNIHGERDIAADNYMIRTNYADTNKPLFILTGSLYNSGAATATNAFVYSQTAGITECIGLVVDASVTYSLKEVSTLKNLTNETIAVMH